MNCFSQAFKTTKAYYVVAHTFSFGYPVFLLPMITLGEYITKNSSFQTYSTFKLLADHMLVQDSFRGYAYFRWVDDEIDTRLKTKKHRVDFMIRQRRIINAAYEGKPVKGLTPEERLIVDLISRDRNKTSKLGSFIFHFMDIIEFDARRKGTTVSEKQLSWYSKTLAVAVIDCIQYFINHGYQYPSHPARYRAAIGAHIAHMLRDYREDLDEGFINIPKEYLTRHHMKPTDIDSPDFRRWVKKRVKVARLELRTGMGYWADIPVLKGKLAAYWYCARFLRVLDAIEQDHYMLRRHYARRNDPISYGRILIMGLRVALAHIKHTKIVISA